MELFYYEWDDNNLDNVLENKPKIEKILGLSVDWQEFANYKLKKQTLQWIELDFVGQSKWTNRTT